MSKKLKFSMNTVFGVAVSSIFVGGIAGCVNANATESTATAETGSALSAGQAQADSSHDGSPRAAQGVVDPGVRGGDPGAGGIIPSPATQDPVKAANEETLF